MKLNQQELSLVCDALLIMDDFVVENLNKDDSKYAYIFNQQYLKELRELRDRLRNVVYKND